jgi:hypothetical protein
MNPADRHVDGRIWLARAAVRKDEASTRDLGSPTRDPVVSCLRSEWEIPDPDYGGLLARSVAAGASHSIVRPEEPSALGGD